MEGTRSVMRAVVVRKAPRRVEIEPRPEPSPAADQAVVATRVVGMCRSDIDLVDGHLDRWLEVGYPVIPGHEWSGEIVTVTGDVRGIKAGDRVTGCGALGRNRWFGFTDDGAAVERFSIDASLLKRLPAGMSYEQGALIEPFACIFQGLALIGGARPGDRVCVLGADTMGILAAVAVRGCGVSVAVADPDPVRRKVALQMGADAAMPPGDLDAVERVLGSKPNLVIEAAGAPAALAASLEIVADGGRVLFLGLCPAERTPAPMRLIQVKNLYLRGSTGAPFAIWDLAIRFLQSLRTDLSPIICTRFGLESVPDALQNVTGNLKVHIRVSWLRARSCPFADQHKSGSWRAWTACYGTDVPTLHATRHRANGDMT